MGMTQGAVVQEPTTSTPGRANGLVAKVRSAPPAYRRRVLWYLMAPAVLCEALVYVVPILVGVFTSFTKVNQFTIRDWFRAPFIGFDNFKLIFGSPAIGGPILRSLLLSLGYVVAVVAVSLFLGFVATVFVRSLRRGRFFQIFFVLPTRRRSTPVSWRGTSRSRATGPSTPCCTTTSGSRATCSTSKTPSRSRAWWSPRYGAPGRSCS